MGLVCLPSIMTFRCLECFFGFTPAWVLVGTKNASRSGSLWLYVQRNGFILWPKLDSSGNRTLPASLDSMWTEIKGYLLNLVIGAMAHSFMAPFNYAPFLSGQEATGIFVTYSIFQLGNNFFTAVLVGHSLSLSMKGISLLMQTIGGCQTEAVTNQPLFASKSPSDFWSNRWNKLIHTGIKQGVYKPVRFYSLLSLFPLLYRVCFMNMFGCSCFDATRMKMRMYQDSCDLENQCCSLAGMDHWFLWSMLLDVNDGKISCGSIQSHL